MDSKAADLIACPACKGGLVDRGGSLFCERCSIEYPIVDGIPRLFPGSDSLTIDPEKLRIKDRRQAAATLADMRRSDYGFISAPRLFYIIYLLLAFSLVVRFFPGAMILAGVLLADWIVFRFRRGRILRRHEDMPVRLRSVADYEMVDEIYRHEGKSQPTMSDWVRLAGETAARGARLSAEEDEDKERYLDILDVYRRTEKAARVVVDVGANDGRAYWEFGIGKGKVFVGIDISRLLLSEFIKRAPGQIALQADGISLPLASSSVDFLFCTETLEHLSDPTRAVKEFARVLRPEGRLMIQSPNAHRIRNLNLLHIAALALSFGSDNVLQKKRVHENTWHNAATYHWDFSVQDYRSMAMEAGLRIVELRGRQFFFPRFLLRGSRGAAKRVEKIIGSIPFLRMLGDDLVMVAEAVPSDK